MTKLERFLHAKQLALSVLTKSLNGTFVPDAIEFAYDDNGFVCTLISVDKRRFMLPMRVSTKVCAWEDANLAVTIETAVAAAIDKLARLNNDR